MSHINPPPPGHQAGATCAVSLLQLSSKFSSFRRLNFLRFVIMTSVSISVTEKNLLDLCLDMVDEMRSGQH